jgi:hypothetical protein
MNHEEAEHETREMANGSERNRTMDLLEKVLTPFFQS